MLERGFASDEQMNEWKLLDMTTNFLNINPLGSLHDKRDKSLQNDPQVLVWAASLQKYTLWRRSTSISSEKSTTPPLIVDCIAFPPSDPLALASISFTLRIAADCAKWLDFRFYPNKCTTKSNKGGLFSAQLFAHFECDEKKSSTEDDAKGGNDAEEVNWDEIMRHFASIAPLLNGFTPFNDRTSHRKTEKIVGQKSINE